MPRLVHRQPAVSIKLRRSEFGFTLVELMIVVAIIGILAAIAVPNFLIFQLRAKSAECKANLAAIRVAEEALYTESGTYIATGLIPSGVPNGLKRPWESDPNGFDRLGFEPEGSVYFGYQATMEPGNPNAYSIGAQSDIDENGEFNYWGYIRPAPGMSVGLPGPFGVCVGEGVYDATTQSQSLVRTVGPCNAPYGMSVF